LSRFGRRIKVLAGAKKDSGWPKIEAPLDDRLCAARRHHRGKWIYVAFGYNCEFESLGK